MATLTTMRRHVVSPEGEGLAPPNGQPGHGTQVPTQALRTLRFTTENYHRLVDSGILGEDDRTELLDGEVFFKMPIDSRHAGCVNFLNRLLSRLLPQLLVTAQNPVRLGPSSEPEPDLAVLRSTPDDYRSAHPSPSDVFLLIEVANSSLSLDRDVKAPLYAAAGIPELWIVDLTGEAVEVFQDPDPAGFRRYRRHVRGETVTSGSLPNLSLTVDEILGPPTADEAEASAAAADDTVADASSSPV